MSNNDTAATALKAVTDWLDGSSELSLDDLVDTVANLSTAAIRTVLPDI